MTSLSQVSTGLSLVSKRSHMSLRGIHHSSLVSTGERRKLCSLDLAARVQDISSLEVYVTSVLAAVEEERVEYPRGGASRNRGDEVEYPQGAGAETKQDNTSIAWEQSQAAIDD